MRGRVVHGLELTASALKKQAVLFVGLFSPKTSGLPPGSIL